MKGNLVFSIMFEKFRFDGDFFARNLDAVEGLNVITVLNVIKS